MPTDPSALDAQEGHVADSDDDEDNLERPGKKEHRCTDPFWLIFLIAALLYELQLIHYAFTNMNIKILVDYRNEIKRGMGRAACIRNASEGHVFWCLMRNGTDEDTGDLLFTDPICKQKCPDNNETRSLCLDPSLHRKQYVFDYPTELVDNSCIPKKTHLPKLHQAAAWRIRKNKWFKRTVSFTSAVWMAKWVILSVLFVAVIMSYIFLYFVEAFGATVVWICVLSQILGPGYFGYKILAAAFLNDTPADSDDSTGHTDEDLVLGCGLLLFATTILLMFLCTVKNLPKAAGCIQAAAECVFELPGLLAEPLIALIIKLVLPFGLLLTVFVFLTTGYHRNEAGEVELNFEGKPFGWETVIYCFSLFLWAEELSYALSQYVLSYASQLWYFADIDPSTNRKQNLTACGICAAYVNAVRYHLGSLALGSLLTGVARLPRALLSLVEKTTGHGTKTNQTAEVCDCCLRFYRDYLEFISPAAYMDICLSSAGFFTAGKRASKKLREQRHAVKKLAGAQFLFSLAGLSIVTATVFMVTYFLCEKVKSIDLTWQPTCVYAVLNSVAIASHFMMVFDHVGETLLFCYAVDDEIDDAEEEPGFFAWLVGGQSPLDRPSHVPGKLRKLLDDHAPSSDSDDGQGH